MGRFHKIWAHGANIEIALLKLGSRRKVRSMPIKSFSKVRHKAQIGHKIVYEIDPMFGLVFNDRLKHNKFWTSFGFRFYFMNFLMCFQEMVFAKDFAADQTREKKVVRVGFFSGKGCSVC